MIKSEVSKILNLNNIDIGVVNFNTIMRKAGWENDF